MPLKKYIQLMRLNKPIGILLLLWPTLWALWIAAGGLPSVKNFFIFIAGVIIMRSAGCVINDFADRNYDSHVLRTQARPLATAKISTRNAITLFLVLCFIAFILVLFTNALTIKLAFFAVITAIIYPFMKRYTHWPQFILGVAFSFSIPMAFAAETNHVPLISLLIMLINILWTIVYDTQYAMVDRADDLKIGIKSTAILFGKHDRLIIGLFQISIIILLCLLGYLLSFSTVFFIAIFIAALLFLHQQKLIKTHDPKSCFQAFLNNQWVGLIIFSGIFLNGL
ncbi:MAG: 4-hydroxybenzoate octaprenyltransferase [Gammaproteobacteria bacterium]|nr:4-hydroxybenzoate octaprenyltransferase [Gammaproteobacteria bacterium]